MVVGEPPGHHRRLWGCTGGCGPLPPSRRGAGFLAVIPPLMAALTPLFLGVAIATASIPLIEYVEKAWSVENADKKPELLKPAARSLAKFVAVLLVELVGYLTGRASRGCRTRCESSGSGDSGWRSARSCRSSPSRSGDTSYGEACRWGMSFAEARFYFAESNQDSLAGSRNLLTWRVPFETGFLSLKESEFGG